MAFAALPRLGEIFRLYSMVVLVPNRRCNSLDRVLILQCGGFTGLKLSYITNNNIYCVSTWDIPRLPTINYLVHY